MICLFLYLSWHRKFPSKQWTIKLFFPNQAQQIHCNYALNTEQDLIQKGHSEFLLHKKVKKKNKPTTARFLKWKVALSNKSMVIQQIYWDNNHTPINLQTICLPGLLSFLKRNKIACSNLPHNPPLHKMFNIVIHTFKKPIK